MSVRIRLKRLGRKKRPFYHIVVADSRVSRNGKIIEKIGFYNPIPNPAEISLDVDKAVDWLDKGAQPSDTARAILSYKGVLYKKHLLRGVKKGSFDLETAEKKFQEWLDEKTQKIDAKKSNVASKHLQIKDERLKAEIEKNEKRIQTLSELQATADALEVESENNEASTDEVAEGEAENTTENSNTEGETKE